MKILVFSFPVVLVLGFLCVKLSLPDAYTSLIQEDSSVELMQAFFYFIASILSLHVSINFLKNKMFPHGLLYSMLTFGLLFISIEEISWGQRFLDIPNPTFFEAHNSQKEISLHNLYIVQHQLHNAYILVGAYGAFAWILLPPFVPRSRANCRHIAHYLIPDWFIGPYFFFTCFIYMILDYISPPSPGAFLVWRDQEPMELLLAIGFFSFVVSNYCRQQQCFAERSTCDRFTGPNCSK